MCVYVRVYAQRFWGVCVCGIKIGRKKKKYACLSGLLHTCRSWKMRASWSTWLLSIEVNGVTSAQGFRVSPRSVRVILSLLTFFPSPPNQVQKTPILPRLPLLLLQHILLPAHPPPPSRLLQVRRTNVLVFFRHRGATLFKVNPIGFPPRCFLVLVDGVR